MKYIANSKKIISIIVVIFIVLVSFFFGTKVSEFNLKNFSVENTIAIVNNDQSVKEKGKVYNYGNISSDLILSKNSNSDYQFVTTTKTAAEQGVKNNKYVAMIVIPSDFTKATLSVEDTSPVKSQLIYKINENLTGSKLQKVQNDTMNYTKEITDNLAYLYVYSILEQVHESQAGIKKIKENQKPVFNYATGVEETDLFNKYTYELGEIDSTEIIKSDVNPFGDKYKEITQTYSKEYENNISVMEEQNRETKVLIDEDGRELTVANREIDSRVENIKTITNKLYDDNINTTKDTTLLNKNSYVSFQTQNYDVINIYKDINNSKDYTDTIFSLSTEYGTGYQNLFGSNSNDILLKEYELKANYYSSLKTYYTCTSKLQDGQNCNNEYNSAKNTGTQYFNYYDDIYGKYTSEKSYFNSLKNDGNDNSNNTIYWNGSTKETPNTLANSASQDHCDYINLYNKQMVLESYISTISVTPLSNNCLNGLSKDKVTLASNSLDVYINNLKSYVPFSNTQLDSIRTSVDKKIVTDGKTTNDLKYTSDELKLCQSSTNILCQNMEKQNELLISEEKQKIDLKDILYKITPNPQLVLDNNDLEFFDNNLTRPNNIGLTLGGYYICNNSYIQLTSECSDGGSSKNMVSISNLLSTQMDKMGSIDDKTTQLSLNSPKVIDPEKYNTMLEENKEEMVGYIKTTDDTNEETYNLKVDDYSENQSIMSTYIGDVGSDTTYQDMTSTFVGAENKRQDENGTILYNINGLMPNSQFNGVSNKLLYKKIATPNEITNDTKVSENSAVENSNIKTLQFGILVLSGLLILILVLHYILKKRFFKRGDT